MSVSAPPKLLAFQGPRHTHAACLKVITLGLIVLMLSLLLAASQGAYALTWHDALQLWAVWQDPGQHMGTSDPDLAGAQVFWHIRAPRLLMAALTGMALGLAGAAIQGLFRNPLADPGLIGIHGGAALGAASFIVLGPMLWHHTPGFATSLAGMVGAMVAAFIGSVLTTALVWRLARQLGQIQVPRLLLVGVAINALAGSGLGLLSYLADDTQLRALSFWLLGSLAPSQWPALSCVLPLVAVACLLLPRHAPALNALALGEAQARLMGINVPRLQRHCVWLVALAVGAVTAVVGMVGFVGLLAPHAVRLMAGPNHHVVLPGSALLGASLVLLGDTAARTLFAPVELPLGVLTGLLGAPTFLWILQRRAPSPGAH